MTLSSAGGRIVVAGEALCDLVPDADGRLLVHPGGGPFNTARTVARLGRPVAFVGRLSTDGFGRRLEALLASDGVGLDAVARTEDPTTLALVELDGAGAASYRFYARGTSAPGLTPEAALAAVSRGVAALHVGTLGLALEPIAATLETVVERVAGRTLVMVDPNCRPDAAPDEAVYRARLERVIARADIVKVSDEDLAWLRPETPPEAAARDLLCRGPALVLLTRGAHGAVAVTPAGEHRVDAPAAQVVDTIGAGDAFGGAFLAWWHARGHTRAECADPQDVRAATAFACVVAARTCERAGADPPRLSEL